MLTNNFKASLAAGRTQIGMWAGLADTYATEIIASSGFDWVLLDAEHGPNDLRSVLRQLQAVGGYSTHPVVRLPSGDPVLIKQYLDIGAQTLLIPMVETGEQAEQLVAATRYPPQGIRGVASARASRWGGVAGYHAGANDSICLLIQVETAKGVAHLDELVKVSGVDGIFVGPWDLAASLGHLGEPRHPEVVKAIESTIDRIVQSGKAAGIVIADTALAHAYIQRGVTFCAVGIDTMILAQAARALARSFKGDVEPPKS